MSVDGSGGQGDGESDRSALSADGRFVAFRSGASNLVAPGDTNGSWDIFVHDRQTGATEQVSVNSSGGQANNSSDIPSISGDGRLVAFDSLASNLVPRDTNRSKDVFVHDRQTVTTERVSVDSSEVQGNGDSFWSAISEDGGVVAFNSQATNLVWNDTNGYTDVFARDRRFGLQSG